MNWGTRKDEYADREEKQRPRQSLFGDGLRRMLDQFTEANKSGLPVVCGNPQYGAARLRCERRCFITQVVEHALMERP